MRAEGPANWPCVGGTTLRAGAARQATGRAFSPCWFLLSRSWGVAPGWYEFGPLALQQWAALTHEPIVGFVEGGRWRSSSGKRVIAHHHVPNLCANGATHTSLGQRPKFRVRD